MELRMRRDWAARLRRRARKRRHRRILLMLIAFAVAALAMHLLMRTAGTELARRQAAQQEAVRILIASAIPIDAEWTCPLPPVEPGLPDWRAARSSPIIYKPADPNRIGPWTWARQYNQTHAQ